MGIGFRKRIKIAPGIRINVGKRGASVSVGGKGATVNVGKKGVKATIGIPGSGISQSNVLLNNNSPQSSDNSLPPVEGRQTVGILLFVGIFLMPYIFAFFLLRTGYSTISRLLSFSWLIIVASLLLNQ